MNDPNTCEALTEASGVWVLRLPCRVRPLKIRETGVILR